MEWLSVADISKITRIPAPTARRYASLFRDFLPSRKVGRVTKYPEDAVRVFETITRLYNDGHVTSEIEEILKNDYARTIDVDSQPGGDLPMVPGVDGLAFAHDMIDKLAQCLEVIADQKLALEAQRTDITKLKQAFVMLARNQKQMKELPSQALAEVAEDLSYRTRQLEAKDQELEAATHALGDEASDMKTKLQILESELVRLRKDRREMETFLQDKIKRLRERSMQQA